MTPESIAQKVIAFWFPENLNDPGEVEKRNTSWFMPDPELDQEIRTRFESDILFIKKQSIQAADYDGRTLLGLIILLDQFSRNIYRGTSDAFANDPISLGFCLDGIKAGRDRELEPIEKIFFYLPLQHSEKLEDQNLSISFLEGLVETTPDEMKPFIKSSHEYAVAHRRIIVLFGRFPHRNKTLGRISTAEEAAYLADGGPTFGQ